VFFSLEPDPAMPTYDDALALFHAWTEDDRLRRHGYAVEAAMEHYADAFDADVEVWRMTGLLHDMDYEKHPTEDEHPYVGVDALRERGYPDVMTEAILGHAPYTGVERTTQLARALFAVDELAGLITAVAYVRPTKLEGMKVKSVTKKLKDSSFASGVDRDHIRQGAEELGVPLNDHIARVIAGMQARADRLGLTAAD
jgi:putative nucleotidyltransferase with HDIG domain